MKTAIPFLITLLIACLEPLQSTDAVTPAPDGGYRGGNTAEGDSALFSLTTGSYNTAAGFLSLYRNTEGNFNTAIGAGALLFNTTPSENTATGAGALFTNGPSFVVGGNGNTADGAFALFHNNSGSLNTAIGDRTLFNNTSGSSNIALGNSAGANVTTASNVICIGSPGANGQNNSCFIGNIFGATAADGIVVHINAFGRLGTNTSSRRFKQDIKPMEHASETLYQLKPVSFRYKQEIDPKGIPQFGLVAEEVEELDPDLVVRDTDGKPYTVRYDQVNAMLLNEFLKEHRKVQEQETTIAELKADAVKQQTAVVALEKRMETVTARLQQQDAKIQKVNDQFEIGSISAQQLVGNHR
jgi:Chaperone of endosialidase